MGVSVRVVAPYVTLRVKALSGVEVVQGYYAGAVLDAAEGEILDRHLSSGMVEEIAQVQPEAPGAPADEAPKGNASREEWAAYAKEKKGAPEEDTRPVDEGGLKQTELRDKYGN